MYYTQNHIVKALVDERLRQASVHRVIGEDAEMRDGPLGRLRHRAGHALIVAGQVVAHGGRSAAHGVQHARQTD